MRLVCLILAAPALAWSQSTAPTTFPIDAVAMTPEALRGRLADKVFIAKPLTDPEIRVQYKGEFAFINIGSASDTGKWRTEGSTVCYEWRRFPASCSQAMLLGDVLYIKRANNGEVIAMQPK